MNERKLQKKMMEFHANIKLDFEDNSKLREKRDLLIEELRAWLKKYADEYGIDPPSFEYFNQGSYAVGLGVRPLPEDDYDIDVALIFKFSKDTVEPFDLKQALEKAWSKYGRTIIQKKPCVTVQYHKNGTESFHVDFASFSGKLYNDSEVDYMAKGTDKSNQLWLEGDPKQLIEIIKSAFSGEDSYQFKRVIKGLKRWKDFNFDAGNGRPIGIALTACALKWFNPVECKDAEGNYYNDCRAMLGFVTKMLDNFKFQWHKGQFVTRLNITLPIPPGNDLFEKMSNTEMKLFEQKLSTLKISLQSALNADTIRKACLILRKEFGSDFPVPEEDTSQAQKLNGAFINGNLAIGLPNQSKIPVINRGGFYGR